MRPRFAARRSCKHELPREDRCVTELTPGSGRRAALDRSPAQSQRCEVCLWSTSDPLHQFRDQAYHREWNRSGLAATDLFLHPHERRIPADNLGLNAASLISTLDAGGVSCSIRGAIHAMKFRSSA